MSLPFAFLVSQGMIVVRGTVPARFRAGGITVVLVVGKRRLRATPDAAGVYRFEFASRHRLLAASLFATDSRNHPHCFRRILIWQRRPRPVAAAVTPAIADRLPQLSGAFDAAFYLAELTSAQRRFASPDPLGHYLSTGWKLGIAPHRWFDVAWYLRENPALLASGREPFGHYLAEGWKLERHPHPGFDNTFYLARHPELMLGESSPLHRWNLHPSPEDVRACVPRTAPSPSDFSNARPYPLPAPGIMRQRVAAYRRNRKPGNTVACFTGITGNYDTLRLPEHLSPEIDYHVFVDQPVSGYGVFHVHVLDLPGLTDPARRSRHSKLHPHLLLAGYDVVIFIDANVIIRGDLMAHVGRFRDANLPLAFVPHPARNCLYEESVICVAGGRDSAARIVPQMLSYQKEGFPHGFGLNENNVIACRPSRPEVKTFFEAWWNELERGSRRDQLSACYVLWKLGLKTHRFLGPAGNTRNHPDVALVEHGTYDYPAFAHLADDA